MQLDLTKKEFRRLLDMVYIGNWILNSTRGDDRIADYDDLESKLFSLTSRSPRRITTSLWRGWTITSPNLRRTVPTTS